MDRNLGCNYSFKLFKVALRKESVDRNSLPESSNMEVIKSLSARRAWIEIKLQHSIDMISQRRSPQGERG